MSAALTVRALGGVGRFGENGLWLTHEGQSLLVDAGAGFFPDGNDFGQDRRVLDPSAVPHVGAYFITHGHEDHIGGLDTFLRTHPAPVYGTRFTLNALSHRLSGDAKRNTTLIPLEPNVPVRHAAFEVTGYTVNHSLPEALLFSIDTPQGRLVHSGDFRATDAPHWGWPTDRPGLEALGEVRALFIDSTGAPYPGANIGDAALIEPLTDAMRLCTGAFVITTYARHLERVAVIAEACRRSKRRLAFAGSGFRKSLGWASHLDVGIGDVMAPKGQPMSVPRHRLVVLATGTQGEMQGGLSRLVSSGHKGLSLRRGDAVCFSARTIPGQEVPVRRLKAKIVRRGAHLITDLPHVSGHGQQDDLAFLMQATNAACVVPLHGDPYALEACAELAAATLPGAEVRRIGRREMILDDAGIHVQAHPEAPRLTFEDSHLMPASHIAARQQMAKAGVLIVDLDAAGEYRLTPVALSPRADVAAWTRALQVQRPAPADAVRYLEEHVLTAPRRAPLVRIGPQIQQLLDEQRLATDEGALA